MRPSTAGTDASLLPSSAAGPTRVADGQATVEGGDVLVLGNGAVLVGMSERTTPQGIERLAKRLFAGGQADRVVGRCGLRRFPGTSCTWTP